MIISKNSIGASGKYTIKKMLVKEKSYSLLKILQMGHYKDFKELEKQDSAVGAFMAHNKTIKSEE